MSEAGSEKSLREEFTGVKMSRYMTAREKQKFLEIARQLSTEDKIETEKPPNKRKVKKRNIKSIMQKVCWKFCEPCTKRDAHQV